MGCYEPQKTNHKTIATLLALIPGFGHFYNRQYWQGGAILAVLAAYVYLTMNTVIQGTQGGGIAGLFTLGTVPGQDHSLFFLVEGLFSLFLIAVGLGIYLFSIYDARKMAAGATRANRFTVCVTNIKRS